jgi:peptidoglycan/LPS O-acetylase OafA/YrhL
LFPEVLSGYIWEVRLWSLFLTGMLIHTLGCDLRIGWRHVACALALVALDWTRSQALTPSPLTWFGILLVAGTLALAVGTARLPFARHLQRHDYSYGIYIYHWPVLLTLRTAFAPLGHWRLLALGLVVTGVLAVLSWHFVEAPALRAIRRRLRRAHPSDADQRQPAGIHPG